MIRFIQTHQRLCFLLGVLVILAISLPPLARFKKGQKDLTV